MSKLPLFDPAGVGGLRLRGRVVPAAQIGSGERAAMFALLDRYFVGVTPGRFAADLAEKEWVILLEEPMTGGLCGFSTLMQFPAECAGEPVTALFSGDTIIDRDYWGETILPRLWARHVFDLAGRLRREGPVYWFLICSGYKTYRFLPVFYREFFPAFNRSTPPQMKALLDALGRQKFPRKYDAASGVVRMAFPTPLRAGVADITPDRLRDPHVAFFAEANPGHARGDELACLTELCPANLTRAGRRMLGLDRGEGA